MALNKLHRVKVLLIQNEVTDALPVAGTGLQLWLARHGTTNCLSHGTGDGWEMVLHD